MPAKKKSSRRKRGNALNGVRTPSFLMGLTIGLVISVLIFYVGRETIDKDEEFLKTFPEIDKVFPNTRFEFPDRLLNSSRQDDSADSVVEPTESDTQPVADVLATSPERDPLLDETALATPEIPQPDDSPTVTDPTVTGYMLQAGAFGKHEHASAFRASLLLQGYDAYTTQLQDSDSPAPYRVIVGPYDTPEDSYADYDRLKERNISAFLVKMKESGN